ncbi:UDP-glucose 4-epimerase GalE [Rhizobium ruizarguesonis]|jgi:UDP-glucose 4-epimerase|uniref:UDP-glucose 4-epimerase n=3 Tax=Rhizobium TaxID=379 RepID=A0A154IRP2_RHILE|nr:MULTISPECIES: UDP-glucose 4-epimerase GalE [Rhizobium]NKJ75336.1 UDP-glucose 4-epimerase GalE [Rhizobium leguminosarum bv. viciae]QJS29869.1 UDP-glucose 4-epimerase GalE [Rhizobium leguminosarum bv. trifolii TA1]KZB03046.1 UDP-glucose 4-epimerase GalE [Rhizobium leguminosarum]MBC2806131.1 UDP-glucose 4-epimerase GalE [Rhizobium ruizarguesonis]MBY5831880.1 UDP-glucose 4-epimerase GalE [Rhizobium leguminosarum]
MAGETVLVVGGAGYIGSHTCLDLANKGYAPVVFDNFSNGHREFVRWGPAEEGDIRDRARLDEVLAKHKPAAILHFAALIEVGESVKDPVSFYENNVIGTLTLLSAAQAAGINAFVFSSTCATYGLPQSVPLDETHRQVPINPYGRTKYIVEQALADYDQYRSLRSVVLRYFNAAGADFEGRIGEWHQPETHAIPLAIDAALGRRQGFKVFGSDYETRDGTCVRDYIHVLDLADAHVRAVEYLLKGGDSVALNLGTGTGTTVKELLGAIEDVSNRPFPVEYIGRREGDSHTLVANNDKARDVLGWVPQYDLSEIIRSAWDWHAKSNQH